MKEAQQTIKDIMYIKKKCPSERRDSSIEDIKSLQKRVTRIFRWYNTQMIILSIDELRVIVNAHLEYENATFEVGAAAIEKETALNVGKETALNMDNLYYGPESKYINAVLEVLEHNYRTHEFSLNLNEL
jgi:hypothetical protein